MTTQPRPNGKRHTPHTYVPLSVNYAHDEAIRRAGYMAELLYIRALAYAKRTNTSGFVPAYDLEVVAIGLRGTRKAVQKLVEVGLWEAVDDGWIIRSWHRWNADAEAVSAGGRLGNHKRWHRNRGVTDPNCEHCTDRGAIGGDVGGDIGGDSLPDVGGDIQYNSIEVTTPLPPSAPRSGRGGEPETFAEFWAAYPCKQPSRKAALASYRQAVKRADHETIMAGVARYKFSPDPSKRPHATTWLNQDRWTAVSDQQAEASSNDTAPTPTPAHHRPMTADEIAEQRKAEAAAVLALLDED